MTQDHIVKKFDKNLHKIKSAIMEMGHIVGLQLRDATAVLQAYDPTEVERITTHDRIVNGLEKDIYNSAELLIARRQPVALDLRQTLAPINIAGELERIGDHAKSTAKRAHIINATPEKSADLGLIIQMSEILQSMLVDILRAYDTGDLALATTTNARDATVDALNSQLLQMAIETLPKTPDHAAGLIHLALISRNFERIGDHICNIARYVHQIETGEDPKASSQPDAS